MGWARQQPLNFPFSSWVRCEKLSAAMPKLRQAFKKQSHGGTVFPLFTQEQNELLWREVPMDSDSERRAAILVPLVSWEGVPSLLYTTRSNELPTHASEVSFPGGHFDEALDETLEDTALREAQEELLGDYPWESVELIGQTSPLPSIRGTPVTAVVGVLPYQVSANTFPGNAGEVAEVFAVPLKDLVEMETFQASERFHANIPVFPVAEDKQIWGLTAVVTRPLLHKIFRPVLLAAPE